MKLPDRLRSELEATGFPWEIEPGTKHQKIKLGGKLVAILPRGKAQSTHKRSLLNTIAQVRRAAQEMKTP
jgi:hypothetical protein